MDMILSETMYSVICFTQMFDFDPSKLPNIMCVSNGTIQTGSINYFFSK